MTKFLSMNNQGKIYMNRKHMVAGSEVNKRQDFTIKYVQGWELINTKFKHGSMVLRILEVTWGGRKGYWIPEWVGNISVMVCGCYRM